MKTIGLIGGMSWESSLEYYRILNEETKNRLGETHSAKCLMYSFDFHEIEVLQRRGDWDKLTTLMVESALNLKHGGAECLVICTNTMHKMASVIKTSTGLPVIHIADETGKVISNQGLKKIALLGTKFTMEGDFYIEKLKAYGIEVMIPDEPNKQIIHDIIYNELILGIIKNESKQRYIEIIHQLKNEGAEGIILGCTEIPLLIKESDVKIPIFDTTFIHAKGALDYAID
ncbi:MAG: aspartate/glutamate racemase family protein [Clostridiales bacterium]|nr:aspartate/glutamate racemase family protein [Clostridiales bacterium]